MMKFFKQIGKNSEEIGSQKGARTRQLQTSSKVGRPVCTTCTGQPGRPLARERSTGTDWHAIALVGRQTYLGADLHLLLGFRLRF